MVEKLDTGLVQTLSPGNYTHFFYIIRTYCAYIHAVPKVIGFWASRHINIWDVARPDWPTR
jgi:hypothetical protein